MNGNTTRRAAIRIVGAAAATFGGCLNAAPGDEREQVADGTTAGDELGRSNSSIGGRTRARTNARDHAPNDPGTGSRAGGADEDAADQRENTEPEPTPPGEPDPRAAERARIDRGEPIAPVDEWYGTGGATVSVDREETVTESGALRVELEDARYATAGYDFPEPLDLEGRHLSAAVRVEAPTGGELELRLRAPSSERRFVCTRRLPPETTDWMRVDLGITRGKRSPAADDVRSLRVHVAGADPTDVRFWIDDIRVTAGAGESYAILAFYGGRREHYETAFPILEDRGLSAAVPVSPIGIGAAGRMDVEELRELRDAGWDVCSFPARAGALPDHSRREQRNIVAGEQARLENFGFEDGARHFFAPRHRMNGDTIDVVREFHGTGFLYGGNSAGMPPTAPHTLPVLNGGDYESSRSAILRADRHGQLVILAFDRIGPDGMSVEAFEAQLDRIESNAYAGGLTVITPSALLDDHL